MVPFSRSRPPHYQAHRHTLQLIVGKLEARALVVGIVIFHRNAQSTQLVGNFAGLHVDGLQLLGILVDRNNHHLYGSQFRRQHQTVVVAVGHNEGTHQAGRNAPRSCPYIFEFVVFVDELHVERLGEILPEEMRRTRLQGFPVLHHGLDGIGIEGAGKPLVSRFHTLDNRHGHEILGKVGIDIEHTTSLGLGLLASSMCGVPLLPQELGGAQEEAGAHLPTEHVGPLVAQDR